MHINASKIVSTLSDVLVGDCKFAYQEKNNFDWYSNTSKVVCVHIHARYILK